MKSNNESNTRKLLSRVVILLPLILMLAGCGGGSSNPAQLSNQDKSSSSSSSNDVSIPASANVDINQIASSQELQVTATSLASDPFQYPDLVAALEINPNAGVTSIEWMRSDDAGKTFNKVTDSSHFFDHKSCLELLNARYFAKLCHADQCANTKVVEVTGFKDEIAQNFGCVVSPDKSFALAINNEEYFKPVQFSSILMSDPNGLWTVRNTIPGFASGISGHSFKVVFNADNTTFALYRIANYAVWNPDGTINTAASIDGVPNVHIYRLNNGVWNPELEISVPLTGFLGDHTPGVTLQNMAFSLAGDVFAIGVPGGTVLKDINDVNSGLFHAGYAEVWERQSSGNWIKQATLKSNQPEVYDIFGYALSMNSDGTVIAVGAPWHLPHMSCSHSSGCQPANEIDLSLTNKKRGVAYIFANHGTGWLEEAFISRTIVTPEETPGFTYERFDSLQLNTLGTELTVPQYSTFNSGSDNFPPFVYKKILGTWTLQN